MGILASAALMVVFQQPIIVRTSSDAQVRSGRKETVWKTESQRTYCVLRFNTSSDLTEAVLTFKSKSPDGTWISSAFVSDDGSRNNNFESVDELSDTRAVVTVKSDSGQRVKVTFRLAPTGRWKRQ
jgi:hypothetical protein